MNNYTTKKEWMSYCVAALGQGMIYSTMSSYISDFYLSVMKLTPLFVLFLMLFARLWDAINDPIMGYIVDRANPKHGKMKTYLIYTPIPIAILTILMFYSPNLTNTKAMIYAAVVYVAWGMIYTMSDVPFWSLPNVMTPNPDERGNIISKGRTANGVGSAIPMAIFMLLGFVLPKFNLSGTDLEKTKYLTIAIVSSLIGNALFMLAYFNSKERIVSTSNQKNKNSNQKGALKLLFTCKPLMLTATMGILSFARYMFQIGGVHVARYSFYIGKDLSGLSGKELESALQSNISLVTTIFAVASAIGMFVTMLVMPALFKKFNYKQILITTCFIGSISSFIIWFIGYQHFWACLVFFVISCIPLGAINVCLFAMIGDSLDYMEWKTGVRLTGMGSAVQGFVLKLGNALSSCFIILMYIVTNLDVASISAKITANPLDMDPGVRSGMFSIVSLIPAISLLLCTIPLFSYDLVGEKKEKITKELEGIRKANGTVVK